MAVLKTRVQNKTSLFFLSYCIHNFHHVAVLISCPAYTVKLSEERWDKEIYESRLKDLNIKIKFKDLNTKISTQKRFLNVREHYILTLPITNHF